MRTAFRWDCRRAYQQETITAEPGWYVEACFMETQERVSHTGSRNSKPLIPRTGSDHGFDLAESRLCPEIGQDPGRAGRFPRFRRLTGRDLGNEIESSIPTFA
jgi:hypothetical protein